MENLPPRLCLCNKNLHCFTWRFLGTPTRSAIYQINSLRSFIRSCLEYMTLLIQKETMLTSCLHGYTVSFEKIQASSTFFWEAIFATPPTVLAVTIHTLPWKMRVEKNCFFFGMASSLVLLAFRYCVETSNSVLKSTNIALRVLVMHCLLIEETRCWNAYWQR